MNDCDNSNKMHRMSNHFLSDTPTGPVPGRVAPPMNDTIAPPIPARAVPPVPSRPVPSIPARISQPMNPSLINTNTPTNILPRNYGRVAMHTQQQYLPSTVNSPFAGPYPVHVPGRPYVNMNNLNNMNMGGFNSGYNHYGSLNQSMTSQFQNPTIIAAAENARPAFESIQSVIQTFNSISMMFDSTFTAMHMSFQALLGVAENFSRLRMFMMKLYSVIVSFKLVRWFLSRLVYLLRMVRGGRISSADEDLWAALSTTQESIPSDGRSWPLIVFTGLLAATPIMVYNLLNSVTSSSISDTQPMYNDENTVPPTTLGLAIRASNDWSSLDPRTIPLVRGQIYYTTRARLEMATQNGGWLIVTNPNGNNGYVPFDMLLRRPTNNPPPQSFIPEISNVESTLESIPEQIHPQSSTTPIPIICDNCVNSEYLPQQSVNNDDSEKNGVDE